LLGIARESHTNLPYIPSSTIRGRLRASVSDPTTRVQLFGPDLKDLDNRQFLDDYELATEKKLTQLEQGNIWVGDASLLWVPVPSLSHGVVWVSCPILLERWARFNSSIAEIPLVYSTNLATNGSLIYLKDAILPTNHLQNWEKWQSFVPQTSQTSAIKRVLVLPAQHCATLIQMSLWRQVKVKLDAHKSVDGGFRYEEAIPPDTLMYFCWGTTSQANGTAEQSRRDFQQILTNHEILQIGGKDSGQGLDKIKF